jgi:hypothetical protein
MNHDNAGAPRRKLSDILNGGADTIRAAWNATAAATDFAPLPTGTYDARIISGELKTAKSGTPGYKIAFRVLDGEHAGRQFWHDLWLTAAALPMSKRDLNKLGVTELAQLEKPLPPGIRCRCKLALRSADDGTKFNKVTSFDVLGIDTVADDDFAPVAPAGGTPPKGLPPTSVAEPDESPDVPEREIDPSARAAMGGSILFPTGGPKVGVGHD